jgi:probable phosphoglycerate mutase
MGDFPTIVFVRHGETDWNAEGRLQGQRDIPLNDKGRGQAKRNGEATIAKFPDIAAYHFVASPLVRSRETMEIARGAMGLAPTKYRTDDRLREITFGEWEGFTTAELRKANPALIAERDRDKWRFLPPGGESYHLLHIRVGKWLETVTGPTFVVSHGGVGRVLRIHLLGLDPKKVVQADFGQDRVLAFANGREEWI